ncbi:hypothetical protein SAMN05443636_1027 [Halobaculum gomorrense]|uniref:Uncharacterized protein n=2 Tax=Halobaculum gomorrense TaxID=43928 RepID=A0A1M5MIV3_9EURY|nr:hypothetical protein SAMN05443636_1027 [Halobaculum gomorrense]
MLIPGLLLTIALQAVSWIALDWGGVIGFVPGVLSSVLAIGGGFALTALYFRHSTVAPVVK